VWLRGFPGPEVKRRVSHDGAGRPRWSQGGDTLYHSRRAEPEEELWAVSVPRDPLVVGTPTLVTKVDILDRMMWDLHPDGGRFVVATGSMGPYAADAGYLVTLNWFTELDRLLGR